MGKILIANDHGAVELKQRILKHLEGRGFTVENLGVDTEDSVDYPDLAEKACLQYLKGNYDFGILCCGTGIGISISANKVKGIRCALPQDTFAAEMTKKHNNVNFIAFGGRIEYKEPVEKMLDAFIDSPFEGGRHQTRIDKMMALEEK
ncbi:MAG: ribose 5-phosphate isomerase B [Spirochaetales bacterium]|nr:ribose 5-phosphate isomerase B [Spirochaetales bacterium]